MNASHRKGRRLEFARPGSALLLAALLAGCSTNLDELSSSVVLRGKFNLYNCEQLSERGKSTTARVEELKELMRRSAQGPGGEFVNALAYQNEYLIARGDLQQLEQSAIEKKCDQSWRSVSDRTIR